MVISVLVSLAKFFVFYSLAYAFKYGSWVLYANKEVIGYALSELSAVYERHLKWICIIY